jgi:polar amino acid transport system substrate-binding protein
MRNRKTFIVVALLLLAAVAMVGLAVGCGSSSSSSGGGSSASAAPSASASSGSLTGTAAERAQAILGHAPTGLAKTIVDRGSMIISTDANYPPQSSIDQATGKLVGFDIDVGTATANILGLTPVEKTVDWSTVIPGLQTGKWDVSIGSMTSSGPDGAQRAKHVDFTVPYYYTSAQVFVKKGGPQITGPSDLDGKTVGVGAATTYYSYLKQNTKAIVKTYATDADAFPDLRNGNLDFVMTAGPTGQQAILEGQPFDFSGAPLYYEDLSFAVKKGETDWLALLNYAVEKMHTDGTLTALSKKWNNGLDLTVKE